MLRSWRCYSLLAERNHTPQLQLQATGICHRIPRSSLSFIFTPRDHGSIQCFQVVVLVGLALTLHAAGLLQSCQAGGQVAVLLLLLLAGRMLFCRQLLCGRRAHLS